VHPRRRARAHGAGPARDQALTAGDPSGHAGNERVGAWDRQQYSVSVHDTLTGAQRAYANPAGQLSSLAATSAFCAAEGEIPLTLSLLGDRIDAGGGMSKRISIAEARDQLTELVEAAEHGQPIELTREGRSVAALVSLEEHRNLRSPRDLWSALQEFRQSHDLSDLDVDEVYAGVRDPSPGRALDQ
jgi:prevent-host-death family protein